jgi:hypothetical protein
MKTQDSHDALAAGLRAVAQDDERYGSSSAVGMRLMAEVQAIGSARRRRLTLVSLSAAAAVFGVLLIPAWRSLSPIERTQPVDAPLVTRELVTEFFPLTYSNVPARGGYVVRMQVPSSALASFGAAAFVTDQRSLNVLADVVIGDDGLARAVRFVRVVTDGSAAAPGHYNQEQTP